MTDMNKDLDPATQAALDADDLPPIKPRSQKKGKLPAAPAPDEYEEKELPPDIAGFGQQVAEMRAEMPEPVVEERITSATPTKAKTRRVKIIIENEVGQPNFKFVGYNGVGYQIKRGEPVVVPEGVLGVLENAIITRFVQDDKGNRIQVSSIATPFRVLGYVD